MKITMDDLFCCAANKNILDSKESDRAYDKFFKTYIDPVFENNYDSGRKAEDAFSEAVYEAKRHAFQIGFETAVALVVGGVG